MGAMNNNQAATLEARMCTSLTLETQLGGVELIDTKILELRLEYAKVMLESSRARGAARRNEEPSSPVVRARQKQGSTESSSSSSTTTFEGLHLRKSYESLAGMFTRGITLAELETINISGAAELEGGMGKLPNKLPRKFGSQ